MALIHCENCNKTISDKAEECPNCGQKVLSKDSVVCKECEEIVPGDMHSCPNCGCPVSVKDKISSRNKENILSRVIEKFDKKYFIILFIIFVGLVGVCIAGISSKNEQISNEYYENLESATSAMIFGAAKAQAAGNLIKSVWYNTIYEEHDSATDRYACPGGYFNDDFNDSLSRLFADDDFLDTITIIKDNQDVVADRMKKLQNPPEEYIEAYEMINELYSAYLELTSLAINPTGSLQSYSSDFNDADSDVAKCYEKMKVFIR